MIQYDIRVYALRGWRITPWPLPRPPHDYAGLFGLGAHPFLTLTLFIALFERDYAEPLGFQREYAARLSHWSLPYPDIST